MYYHILTFSKAVWTPLKTFVIIHEAVKRKEIYNMKKFLLLCCIVTALSLFAGCGSSDADTAKEVEGSLPELMDTIYTEVSADLPMTGTVEVTDETLPYYLGVESLDYEEALACEPMMGSYAHSVVLVRMKEDADVEAAKEEIKKNIDPRKWICVAVEDKNVIVDNIGHLIILIMSNDQPEDFHEAFLNLAR